MRHPFLHPSPAETGPASPVKASVADAEAVSAVANRRSFFLRLGAALLGAVAVLTGRRSDAQSPMSRVPTTRALGEEGTATTYAVGEEGGPRPPSGPVTTQALGEEGTSQPVTTYAVGEEGMGRPVTTYATGEEGGRWQHRRRMRRTTTFATGEEGGFYRFRF